jgi:HD-GYP domain-containing protein (c-di-GMP phosphodiesterase class II)
VSHAEAREWIVSNYGSQFDPEVVEAFVAREQDFAKVSNSLPGNRPAAQPVAAEPLSLAAADAPAFEASPSTA